TPSFSRLWVRRKVVISRFFHSTFLPIMGIVLSSFWNLFASRKEMRLLMLGLDAAGKTTILYQLKLNNYIESIPTIGFNVEQVQFKKLTFTIWDVGAQGKIRLLWKHYYPNTDALIYVVDTADLERVEESSQVLHDILKDPDMANVKLLVLANKQDIPGAMPIYQLTEKLDLKSINGIEWHIQPTNAKKAEGIIEGLTWLEQSLR
ncbi:hypothetical protein PFISCL1PPCAC_14718, partial [Pristionchus fissidentatus]